ncbi:radical SAM protein [Acrocarpospora pleiomorpha]|uniref:Radical SAM protein n=1 Tax=Acrocarpospora pleiomorpha TaxID=90975 RepID=A0A5M3XT15_9ACTN|nr:FxsB family cyclophane-forming radical SAM/SPASM peptide maturase [Acrocarpospora pleiomorpha]GES24142.1 radical SAM protein [Acrocarpospora pleiomorpha]
MSDLPDIADHRTPRWRPHPFRQFIIKTHSRCNLRCDYCYLYTMADQRWRTRPQTMAEQTLEYTAARIAEHARAHNLPDVHIVLHGGEPLLAGPQRLERTIRTIQKAAGTQTSFSIQTNGVLIDDEMLRLFARLNVRVGVSLDGNASAHDRSRRGPRGGSHSTVVAALRKLSGPEFRRQFGGLLCTIDLRNDPIETYETLLAFRPPSVDFLLPHGNWSTPPPGLDPRRRETPYAEWLIAIFDRWYRAARMETTIRFFEELMNVLLGGGSRIEGVGTSPAGMIVVETDGGIEQSDILSSTYPGAADLGLNVATDTFDDAIRHPGTVVRQLREDGVPTPCRPCRWSLVCGGGLYPHRYLTGQGFDRPSVYCHELDHLISHVRAAMLADLTG